MSETILARLQARLYPKTRGELFAELEREAEERKPTQKAVVPTGGRTIIPSYMTMGVAGSSGLAYTKLVDSYRSWVYTAIDKIAKAVAMMPVKLYVYRRSGKKIVQARDIKATLRNYQTRVSGNRLGEEKYLLKQMAVEREEIFDHPALQLFQRPNNLMTRFMLWYETLVRLELGGLCGWYIAPSRAGVPGEIWPLPLTRSAELTPKPNQKMQIDYWQYRDGSLEQKFKPEEIVALKYPHPASPFMAMSPLMAQTYPYDIDLYIMMQQKALYENKGVPGLHFHTDHDLSPEQAKEMNELIWEQYGGPLKTGMPIVTHSGMSIDKASFSPRESLLTDVAKWSREKLLTSYDLSEGKVGLVSDVNRANMEALNATFIQECLRPKAMLIEEALETFFLPRYDEGLTLDFQLPDVDTREQDRLDMESRLKNYVTVVNEERERLGMEPAEHGEKPWIEMSKIQPGEEMGTQPPPEPPPKKDEEEEEEERFPPINLFIDVDAASPMRKTMHVQRNPDGSLTGNVVEEKLIGGKVHELSPASSDPE